MTVSNVRVSGLYQELLSLSLLSSAPLHMSVFIVCAVCADVTKDCMGFRINETYVMLPISSSLLLIILMTKEHT